MCPQTVFVWGEDEDRSEAELGLIPILLEDSAVTAGDTITIPSTFPFIAGIHAGTDGGTIDGTEHAQHPYTGYWIDGRLAAPGIGGPGVNNLRIHRGTTGRNKFNDACIYDWFDNPIKVGEGPNGIAGDTLTAYADTADWAGNAIVAFIALYVTDTRLPVMPHTITHVAKWTPTTALAAALTWEKEMITLDDDIPTGRYLIWEAGLTSCTAIAARLIVPGVPFRPAFRPRRFAHGPAPHQPNDCIHPGGIPFNYKGGTLNVRVEWCAEAAETALSGYFGLEYLGK